MRIVNEAISFVVDALVNGNDKILDFVNEFTSTEVMEMDSDFDDFCERNFCYSEIAQAAYDRDFNPNDAYFVSNGGYIISSDDVADLVDEGTLEDAVEDAFSNGDISSLLARYDISEDSLYRYFVDEAIAAELEYGADVTPYYEKVADRVLVEELFAVEWSELAKRVLKANEKNEIEAVLERYHSLDLENMTPISALNELSLVANEMARLLEARKTAIENAEEEE